jgi:hypothetical protein
MTKGSALNGGPDSVTVSNPNGWDIRPATIWDYTEPRVIQ